VRRGEIRKLCAAPLHDVVPTFDAFELRDLLDLGQRFDLIERDRIGAFDHQFPVGIGIISEPDIAIDSRFSDIGGIECPREARVAEQSAREHVVRLFRAPERLRDAAFLKAFVDPQPGSEACRRGDCSR
jgi:hypothetical protein